MDGVLHIADRNGNPNVFEVERNKDGLWLNSNWTKPSNKWNPANRFAFFLPKVLLFRIFYKVRFLFVIIEIFLPAAKHLTYFIKFYRDFLALPIRNELSFPGNRDKKFENVQNQNTFRKLLALFIFFCKICNIGEFE